MVNLEDRKKWQNVSF